MPQSGRLPRAAAAGEARELRAHRVGPPRARPVQRRQPGVVARGGEARRRGAAQRLDDLEVAGARRAVQRGQPARRDPRDKLAPIDRDPVPNRFADSVRRYYEELGKDKPDTK